jgi:hypothetical protein
VLFVDALPRTPTHRIAKFGLRKDSTLNSASISPPPALRKDRASGR